MEALTFPRFGGVTLLDYGVWRLRCRGRLSRIDQDADPEGGVVTLTVVEELKLVEDGIGEFDPGPPALPVAKLGSHRPPVRFDDGAVRAVPD